MPKNFPTKEEIQLKERERARKILAERRSKDVLKHFLEHGATVTQRAIIASDAVYTLVTSANQGGKTTVAVADCAAVLRGIHPYKKWFGPVNIIIVVPSRAQAAGIWGERLLNKSGIAAVVKGPDGKDIDLSDQPLIPAHEIEHIDWAHSPQGRYPGIGKLKNGSTFIFILSGDPNSWKRLQGLPKDWVYRDEAVGSESLGNELLPRLIKAQTYVANKERPWGGGITWVATATLVNSEFEAYKKRCMDGADQHAIFWINPEENPAVSMDVRKNMAASMSSEEASVRMFGTADAIHDVLIYRNQWNPARHILKDVWNHDPYDNIWMMWDPGWDHPYGLLFGITSQVNPNQIRMVQAFTGRKRTLDYIANQATMWLNGRMLEGMVFDIASKKTEHSRGRSMCSQMEDLLQQMQVKSYRGLIFGRNRYEDTIPLVQRYLDPDQSNPSATPLVVFDPPTEENGMGAVIEQFASYRTKPGATNSTRGFNIHKENDCFPDCIRYMISREPSFAPRARNVARSYGLAQGPTGPARKVRPEDLPISEDMEPAMKQHILRLRESSRVMTTNFVGNGMPVISSRTWNAGF